jgi:hypothetical protein
MPVNDGKVPGAPRQLRVYASGIDGREAGPATGRV